MDLGLNVGAILLGVAIFAVRVIDVTIGTIRTISTVQGRTKAAFLLGFAEITIWLFVIAAVIAQVRDRPFLGLFYALGRRQVGPPPGFRERGSQGLRQEARRTSRRDHQEARSRGDDIRGEGRGRSGDGGLRGLPEKGSP